MKLSDLVAKHGLPVKVRVLRFDEDVSLFNVEFKLSNNNFSCVYLPKDDNALMCSCALAPDVEVELYTEPKPKVKRWLWAYRDQSNRYYVVSYYYSDEEIVGQIFGLSRDIVPIKMPWSEMSFDE